MLPFLSNRQIGGTRKAGLCATDCRPIFDDQLSRLVYYREDAYPTYVQNYNSFPPFACKFRKDRESDLLALSNEEGQVMLIDTERHKVMKAFMAHFNAIFDICWMPSNNHLITASGDHSACLFDMSTCQLISSYKGHTASLKTVDVCHAESDIFATGSRDGNICIWDRREKSGKNVNKPSIFIAAAHKREESGNKKRSSPVPYNAMSSVSAVAFQNGAHLVSSGVADGVIKVWDLRKVYIKTRCYLPRYQMKYCDERYVKQGCTSLVFDSLYRKLYACTTTNKIYQFDCHSYSNDALIYSGFKCHTYYVKLALSCDDEYLLCGSSNQKAYIWKTRKPGAPILTLPGHNAEVTSVEWSPYSVTKLVTTGDDSQLLVWRTQNKDDAECDYENKALSYDLEDEESESTIPKERDVQIVNTYTPSHRSLSQEPKTLTVRSITNFYSPITPSSTSMVPSHQSSAENSPPFTPVSQGQSSPKASAGPAVSPQSRSPCKTLHDNDGLLQEAGAAAVPKSGGQGKENNTAPRLSAESNTTAKWTGQMKRKLAVQESRSCKHHPKGCGKTKGHTRCGKKIVITPDRHNIKKYFSVSPPE